MDVYKQQVLKEEDPQSKYLEMDFPVPMPIAGIAEALGIHGRTITDPSDLAPAMREALELGKPAVLDVSIDGSI
jgi:thiamine pyrophosphate-dependent acetolactate synthase large subunit-like protein